MTIDPMTPSSAPSAARSNTFERIAGLFTAPAATMREIVANPDWLWPLLLILALTAAGSYAAAPKIDARAEIRPALEKQLEGKDLPEAQVDEMVETQAKIAAFTYQWVWVTIPLLIAISAGVLLVTFNMFGGRATFRQVFSVICYSWIPLTIRGLIAATVVMMRTDDTSPTAMLAASYTNPAFLFDFETQRLLFTLITPLDVLGVFALYVMTLGLSFASGLSKKTSAILVVALWFITFLFRLVPALMQS